MGEWTGAVAHTIGRRARPVSLPASIRGTFVEAPLVPLPQPTDARPTGPWNLFGRVRHRSSHDSLRRARLEELLGAARKMRGVVDYLLGSSLEQLEQISAVPAGAFA